MRCRCVVIVFICSGAFLCCLPACNSMTTCLVLLDRRAYVFPSNIATMSDSESERAYCFKFVVKIARAGHTCTILQFEKVLTFSIGALGNDYKINKNELQNVTETFHQFELLHYLNFTVSAKSIYDKFKGQQFDEAEIVFEFEPSYQAGCKPDVGSCAVSATLKQDNAPTVLFKTNLEKPPLSTIDGPSDLNGPSSSLVQMEMKKIGSKLRLTVVHIEVMDGDYFANISDRFDYCAVREPNITLSAIATFSFSKKSGNKGKSSRPLSLPLATDVDVFQFENAWWYTESARINESLRIVSFYFAQSFLCSAISALSRSNRSRNSNVWHQCSSGIVVNITLNVAATSGRTNPLKSNATFSLIYSIKAEVSFSSDAKDTLDAAFEEGKDNAPYYLAITLISCAACLVLLLFVIWLLHCQFQANQNRKIQQQQQQKTGNRRGEGRYDYQLRTILKKKMQA